mmetsp:Transcript_63037/g.150197  ORF Transcript_63037/g.150197 Transcript_63037/m.150197 type:complete len:314 (-) Transcript_63037:77-1018(-)
MSDEEAPLKVPMRQDDNVLTSGNGTREPGLDEDWDYGDRLTFAGDICWLLKEVGWLLLIPHISIPFGVLATVCITGGAAFHCFRPVEEILPEIVSAVWLAANFLWMLDDCFYDSREGPEQTPWALTPILDPSDRKYSQLQSYAAAGFLAGPILFGAGVVFCIGRRLYDPSPRNRHSLMNLVLGASVASWCLKDYYWTQEEVWPALASDVITIFLLILAAAVQSGHGLRGVNRSDLAWLVWVSSSGVWIVAELLLDENMPARYSAAGLAGLAVSLNLASYRQVKERSQTMRTLAERIENEAQGIGLTDMTHAKE